MRVLVKTVSFLLFLALASFLRADDRAQFVWEGRVDGTAILHLAGKNLKVQEEKGAVVERQKFHFFDALPETQQAVRLQVLKGRGYVHILDQPSLDNHYAVSVEIEDRQSGTSLYSIALYWDIAENTFERGLENSDRVTWTGRVDQGAIISCHKQSCVSTADQGAPVADEHFKFSGRLPERDVDVRLEYPEGRGEIRLIEQPRQRNNYTARVSIDDPQAGSSEYSFTMAWDRLRSKESKASTEIFEPAGRGLVWSGTVDGRVRVTIEGGASFSEVLQGAPIPDEHADIIRPLPQRADLMPTIQKLHGRGSVSILESPSQKNHYRLVFEIDDPAPGADTYAIELDW